MASKPTVLYIDDDADTRRVMRHLFEFYGFEYLEADGGESAKAFLDHKLDCVITDMAMPKGDGMSVTDLFRKRFPKLPIVVISGIVDDNHSKQLADHGATLIFKKPVEMKKVVENVRDLLA